MEKKLPPSIISLIHHSKLNERGWWEKSISNIIIGVIAERDNLPANKEEVFSRLKEYQIDADSSRFDKEFKKLITKGILLPSYSDHYFVCEQENKKFKEAFQYQAEVDEYAKTKFIALASKECPNLNPEELWSSFYQKLLIPLIKENGVRIKEIISSNWQKEKTNGWINLFASSFVANEEKITTIIFNFLNPKDEKITAFIFRLLNAYFFVEASNLEEKVIKEIYQLSEYKSRLDIYVDSNFIFSLLDLHESSYNEASKALLAASKAAKEKVDVHFLILPITLDEFKKVITANKISLKNLNIEGHNLINRAAEIISFGLRKKYFEKCRSAGMRLNVDQYFEPYETHILTTLRNEIGIKLDESDYNAYLEDFLNPKYIRINDDTLNLREFRIEQEKKEGKKIDEFYSGRLYDRILHDMRLWYIVKDKRSKYATPKTVRYWIITLDSKLTGFDRFKQKKESNRIPLCLQPSDLMSILQFWLPRNENLEKAIFENFRLPLMFKDYDDETEQITLNILSALALHEGSEDLSQKTIIEYETDNTIRSKITPDTSVHEIAKLIQEYDELKSQQLAKELEIERSNQETREQELRNKEKSIIQKQEERERREIEAAKEEKERQKIKEIESLESLSYEIKNKIEYLNAQIIAAEKRIKAETKGFWGIFKDKDLIRRKILSEYPGIENLEKEKDKLNVLREKIKKIEKPNVIICENKNDKLFNLLDIEGYSFVGVNNSHDVFIQAKSNPNQLCIRDRDFLSDKEIERIQKKFPNLLILDYYCFENYLYHPDNVEEAIKVNFDKEKYISEIKNQIKLKKSSVIPTLEKTRSSFQELKEDKIKDQEAGSFIHDCFHADSFEKMYLFFSAKDAKTFDKSPFQTFLPSELELVKTKWFKDKIIKIIQG